jgi:orotidine 5'-phosphate decarboxylase subfamily 2
MTSFKERLASAIKTTGSSLCIGIDPDPKELPDYLARRLDGTSPGGALSEFCEVMLAGGRGLAPMVKFQSAYFEAYGAVGVAALKDAIARAKALGFIALLDAKRGDIASTMHAYGRMAFDYMQADALTVTPYMGFDVVEPLTPWLLRGHGIYVVWVTSNASGRTVQELPLAAAHAQDGNVAGAVLRQLSSDCAARGLGSAWGVVLGATKVAALSAMQLATLKGIPLLIPGVGAQGGVVDARLQAVMAASGAAVVAQSRSLSRPHDAASIDSRTYADFVASRIAAAAVELSVAK